MFAKKSFGLLTLLAVVCFFGLSGIFFCTPNPVSATVISSVELGTGLANSITSGWESVVLKGVKSAPYKFKSSEKVAVKATFGSTSNAQTVKVCASLGGDQERCQSVSPAGANWSGFFLTFTLNDFPALAPGDYTLSVVVYDDGVESACWERTVAITDGPASRLIWTATGAGLTTTQKPGEWAVGKATDLTTGHFLFAIPRLWVAGAQKFCVQVVFTPESGNPVRKFLDWKEVNYQPFDGSLPPVEVGHLSAGKYTRRVFIKYDPACKWRRLKGDKDFTVQISE